MSLIKTKQNLAPGISMRCVKEEHTAINMTLHYLDNGTVMLNFIYQKELFFLPLGFVLKVMRIIISTSIFLCCIISNWWGEGSHSNRTGDFNCSSRTFDDKVYRLCQQTLTRCVYQHIKAVLIVKNTFCTTFKYYFLHSNVHYFFPPYSKNIQNLSINLPALLGAPWLGHPV